MLKMNCVIVLLTVRLFIFYEKMMKCKRQQYITNVFLNIFNSRNNFLIFK